MTISEAQSFARNKTLKATGLLLAIVTSFFLLRETRGDLANGILFFMEALVNFHTLIILTILFGLTYFFSGMAGNEIIILKRNVFLVPLKYAILISFAVSAYTMFVGLFMASEFTYDGFKKAFTTYFWEMFPKTFITLLVGWIWATHKMKSTIDQS